jgi:mannose-6-phosphate isomerase-like protein (cupin superfamily)
MADVTVKRIEDFEAILGGGMRRARAGLGVTSFGMQIEDFPPHADRYPEHDHTQDGMEEVYTALSGMATLIAGDTQFQLEPGVFVRVGPGEKRKITTDDEPARILAIGGIPGQPYSPPPFTDEGAPDPVSFE